MNNRPIKFRTWVKDDKKLVHWHEHPEWITDAIPFDSGDEWTENCELMQFTGLVDKNGKEIYEGDIISHPYGTASVVFGRYLGNGGLAHSGFYLDFGSKNIGLDGSIEVIGNIFENPELFK